jgi:hypothetical protein
MVSLEHVTLLCSKRRPNAGPQRINLLVTNLTEATTGMILNHYQRRWGMEVAVKELKCGLHLGQLQVTKESRRVERGPLLPILAYLLLLHLYGREVSAAHGVSLWQLKRRFTKESGLANACCAIVNSLPRGHTAAQWALARSTHGSVWGTNKGWNLLRPLLQW